MNLIRQFFACRSVITLVLIGLLSASAHAGETWDGNGGDNDWTTNNNWNPNGEPPNDGTADIVMAGTNRLTPRVDVDWDIFSLVFNNTAGAFSISGAPGVTLRIAGGGITNQDTQTQTVSVPIGMNSSQTWNASAGILNMVSSIAGHPFIVLPLTLTGANNIQISGAITNGVAINKTGSGTLIFTGSATNAYMGATTVSAGTLALARGGNRAIPGNLVIGDGSGSDVVRLNSSDQISEAAGNTVTVNSSGLLNLNGFNETIQNLTLNGGSVSGGFNLLVNGAMTLNGGSVETALLTVNGATTFTGGTVSVQALTINGTVSSNASSTSASVGGGTLDLYGAITFTVADGAAAVDMNIASVMDNGALIKAGPGVLRIASVNYNTFNGDTVVNEGTLELKGPVGGFGNATINRGLTIGDGSGVDVVRCLADYQFSDEFVSPSRITANSSGLLDLSGFDQRVGVVVLEGGSISTGAGTLEALSNLHTYPSAQSAHFSGNLSFIGPASSRKIIVDDGLAADDLVFDGQPFGGVRKYGAGQMRLVGNTAVSGASYSVFEGTLVLARTGATEGTGDSRVDQGASLVLGANEQLPSGAMQTTLFLDGTLDLAGFNETINDLELRSAGTVIPNGGTLVMQNLTLQGGVLNPSTGLVTVNGTVSSLESSFASLLGGNVNIVAADRTFDISNGTAATDLEVTLPLGGTNSLTKTGAGTLLLSGAANTYSGMTNVSGGVLALGKSDVDGAVPGDLTVTAATVRSATDEQIATTSVITLNAGGVLDLDGFTETIDSLALNGGSVTMGAGTLVVTGSVSQSASAASGISGRLDLGGGTRTITANDVPVPAVDLDISAEVVNGGIVKQGAGALRLGGNNTFAGGVQHQAGKLLIAQDNALGTGALSLEGGTVEADGGARNIANPVIVASLSTVSGSNDLAIGGTFTTNLGAALLKSGAGALTIAGPQSHASGATLFATAGTVNFNSSATGATLNVNLSNSGTMVNFNADQDLNTLVVNGARATVADATLLEASSLSLGAAAVLEFEIGGLMAGNEFAQLVVSGNAALGGTLEITLINGFTPIAGNSFDILDWGSLAGAFDTLLLPTLSGSISWDTTNLYSTGVLSVALAGDYNFDGTVDAADYIVWRKNDGTPAGYDTWRAHFGETIGSGAGAGVESFSAAVPEPHSTLLVMFGIGGVLLIRAGADRPPPDLIVARAYELNRRSSDVR